MCLLSQWGRQGIFKSLIFWRTFGFTAKLKGTEISRICLAPTHAQPLPLLTSPPDGTFIMTDEPTWTCHHHQESTV